MKLFATILLFSSLASASEYSFVYRFEKELLELKIEGESYEVAYDRAALKCFKHFKRGQFLKEERGLDIIDVCANPRKK